VAALFVLEAVSVILKVLGLVQIRGKRYSGWRPSFTFELLGGEANRNDRAILDRRVVFARVAGRVE